MSKSVSFFNLQKSIIENQVVNTKRIFSYDNNVNNVNKALVNYFQNIDIEQSQKKCEINKLKHQIFKELLFTMDITPRIWDSFIIKQFNPKKKEDYNILKSMLTTTALNSLLTKQKEKKIIIYISTSSVKPFPKIKGKYLLNPISAEKYLVENYIQTNLNFDSKFHSSNVNLSLGILELSKK